MPFAALLLLAAQDSPAVRFLPTDAAALEALEARVVGVEKIGNEDAATLVEVEVENSGAVDAEALVFEFDPGARGQLVRVLRVDAPHYGRAGRVAPAGGATVYPLLVPFEEKLARKLEVRVVEASFVQGGARWDELPLVVGRLEVTRAVDPAFGKTLSRTEVAITNRIEHAVDAIFRAEYTDPFRCTTLLRVRLAPATTTVHVQDQLPLSANFYQLGAAIRRLELVDWSVIVDDGAEAGRARMEAAWNDWRRVEPGLFPLRASCTFDRTADSAADSAAGLVQIEADGRIEFDFQDDLSAVARKELAEFGRALAWELTRPGLEEVLGERQLALQRLGEPSIVTFPDPPFDPNSTEHHLLLSGGRIVGDSSQPLGGGLEASWVTESDERGWRVVERSVPYATHDPRAGRIERFDWIEGTDFPRLARRSENREYMGGGTSELLLTFDGWTTNVLPLAERRPRRPPVGALADRLRDAWDGSYRYPDPEATLTGRFRIRTPGTDGVWIGRRDVRGTFELARMRGGFWRDASAEVEGRSLTEDERATLGDAALDRFLMWSSRDLARLPPFEAAFAGATLEQRGAWIVVEGVAITGVRLEAGRVAALRRRDGRETEVVWKQVKKVWVPVEQRTGAETVSVAWKVLGDGWLLPSEVVFTDVFTDWGPERMELSHHAVQRPR